MNQTVWEQRNWVNMSLCRVKHWRGGHSVTRIGLALNVFPPEQIMHANHVLWEGLDRNFEFALPQSDPKYCDYMGSARTTWQSIKIILQRCLEWNKTRIYVQLDDRLGSDLSDWQNYSYFKKDLGLFISALKWASGVAYGEADQGIADTLITFQACTIRRGDVVDYPHGLVQTILNVPRLLLMGEHLSSPETKSRIDFVFKKGPLMKMA